LDSSVQNGPLLSEIDVIDLELVILLDDDKHVIIVFRKQISLTMYILSCKFCTEII